MQAKLCYIIPCFSFPQQLLQSWDFYATEDEPSSMASHQCSALLRVPFNSAAFVPLKPVQIRSALSTQLLLWTNSFHSPPPDQCGQVCHSKTPLLLPTSVLITFLSMCYNIMAKSEFWKNGFILACSSCSRIHNSSRATAASCQSSSQEIVSSTSNTKQKAWTGSMAMFETVKAHPWWRTSSKGSTSPSPPQIVPPPGV